jgi:gliding motility-associated lipoprotein GldH
MKSPIIIFSLLFLLMVSCKDSRQHEDVHIFSETSWQRFDILSFDLPVKSTTDEYTVMAVIRHTKDFLPESIPMHFIMTMPSGEVRIWEQALNIRNRDGKSRGELKDGIYEVLIPIRTRLRFNEPGNCNITVEQIIPKYNTGGIVSFGLRFVRN